MSAWTWAITVASIFGVSCCFEDCARREHDVSLLYQSKFYVKAGYQLDLASSRAHDQIGFSAFVSETNEPTAPSHPGGEAVERRSPKDPPTKEVIANVTEKIQKKNITTDANVDEERKILKEAGDSDENIIHDILSEADSNESSNHSQTETGNSSGEQPFAKENITVHSHVVKVNASEKYDTKVNVTIKETVKVVEVASSSNIVSIYILLFVPIGVGWAMYYHLSMQPKHYTILLSVTLCVMSVGQDLVNQSLIMVMEAPYTVSCIHAYCMALALGLWLLIVEPPNFHEMLPSKLSCWLMVAILFAGYQVVNHVVYSMCSLSERTVFSNLCPLVSLICEKLMMPIALKPTSSFSGKMALFLMLIGAVLFSLQSPSFSFRGVAMASTLVLTNIPYRLAQRHFLGDSAKFSIPFLVCVDGIVCAFPTTAIAATRNHYFNALDGFLSELPVMTMLVLSIITFIGQHVCTLAMLRIGSATSYLVLQSIAGLMTITMGIVFFGDRVMATPVACIGLVANVVAGVWYSIVETMPLGDSKIPSGTSEAEKS